MDTAHLSAVLRTPNNTPLESDTNRYQEETLAEELASCSDLAARLAATPDLCLLLAVDTPRFTVLGASRAYMRTIGTTAGGVLSRGVVELLASAEGPSSRVIDSELDASLRRVMRTGATDVIAPRQYRMPESTLRRDLSSAWWSIRTLPVHGPAGPASYLLVQLDDVTDAVSMKQASEAWIAADAQDLLIAVRTISRQAELLRQSPAYDSSNSAEMRYMAHIQEASVALSQRVDDLLGVLRLAIGHATVARRPIDLFELTRRSAAQVGALEARCHIDLPGEQESHAWADERLLGQAVVHLLNHIVKHSERTHPVSIHFTRGDVAHVRITLENHGPTHMAREFVSEFSDARVGSVRARGQLNRALELYLAKVIIDSHNGGLWADCTAAGTCRWHLVLPSALGTRVTAKYAPVSEIART